MSETHWIEAMSDRFVDGVMRTLAQGAGEAGAA